MRIGLEVSIADLKPISFSSEEWQSLYEIAKKQSMMGIVFSAINKLPIEQRPPRALLLRWIGVARKIETRNVLLNEKCVEISNLLDSVGLCSCILKGQGVAAMYPNPQLRMSGDIDVWVKPVGADAVKGNMDEEIMCCLNKIKTGQFGRKTYMHIDWENDDVSTEVHFRPSASTSPIVNRRMQNWFDEQASKQMQHKVQLMGCPDRSVAVPTCEFNAVYMLHHIYRHLFQEGIGLRQIADYFVLLYYGDAIDCQKKKEIIATLKSFNMLWFARAMMWILGKVFHLPAEKMYVEPDEQSGRFVLSEVLRSGNFGKFDDKYKTASQNKLVKWTSMARRNFSFMRYAPSEVLWYIPFKLYHKFTE